MAKAEVNVVSEDKLTALHIASKHRHKRIVKALLMGKADVNTLNKFGEPALTMGSMKDNFYVIKQLVEA